MLRCSSQWRLIRQEGDPEVLIGRVVRVGIMARGDHASDKSTATPRLRRIGMGHKDEINQMLDRLHQNGCASMTLTNIKDLGVGFELLRLTKGVVEATFTDCTLGYDLVGVLDKGTTYVYHLYLKLRPL